MKNPTSWAKYVIKLTVWEVDVKKSCLGKGPRGKGQLNADVGFVLLT